MHTKYLGSTEGVTIDSPAGVAHITDTYNTGYMLPDTKLAALCDTETGSISAPELVTNGTFDTDTSGWTDTYGGATLTHDTGGDGGRALVTSDGSYAGGYQTINTVIGATYIVTWTAETGDSVPRLRVGPSVNSSDLINLTAIGQLSASFVATTSITFVTLCTSGPSGTAYFDNISVKEVTPDRSGNNNHLNIHGTLNRQPIGNGEIAAWSGFSEDNYLEMPYTPDLDFGTGDFHISCTLFTGSDTFATIVEYAENDGSSLQFLAQLYPINGEVGIRFSVPGTPLLSTLSAQANSVAVFGVFRRNGIVYTHINGEVSTTTLDLSTYSIDGSGLNSPSTFIGKRRDNTALLDAPASIVNLRISKTAPTPDQIAKMYRDELAMIQGKAVLDGNDPAVKALAYDKERDLLHVASQGVVSSFRGLERVESTLDGAGSEMVVDAVSASSTTGAWKYGTTATCSIDGNKLTVTNIGSQFGYVFQGFSGLDSSKSYRVEWKVLNRSGVSGNLFRVGSGGGGSAGAWDIYGSDISTDTMHVAVVKPVNGKFYVGYWNTNNAGGSSTGTVSVKEVSPVAPFTSLSAQDGALILSGDGGVDVQLPEVNIRERLAKTISAPKQLREDFEFTGDGTETTFTLNYGWKPKRVWVDGVKKRQGSAEDYTVAFDGFKYSVVFAVAPALDAEIDIEGVSV